jgi:hypothetical protein
MFHLIGSRYYGVNREDSDYDYIAQDTPENRALCESLGMQRVPDDPRVRYYGNKHDVMLYTEDVNKYVKARDELAKRPVYGLTTDERHALLMEILQEDAHGMV